MAVSRAQSRFSGAAGIVFEISIDEVAEAIGAGLALSHAPNDMVYIDSVVDEAFARADAEFNVQAAALGETGAISHMYEWGTVGINRGRSNMRPNPMSESARLWHNFSEGAGLDRSIFFTYRPSVAFVPKPTAGETGMSSATINKMRDAVFRWKAEVMEEGEEVTISPRRKFLLIPAYEENREYMRPHDIKRGYTLTQHPVTLNPGINHYSGNFTKFWTEFWESEGNDILYTQVNNMLLEDFTPPIVKPRTDNTFRPVGTFTAKQLVALNQKKVAKQAVAKAKKRRVTKTKR
jgi:hypothetical protein